MRALVALAIGDGDSVVNEVGVICDDTVVRLVTVDAADTIDDDVVETDAVVLGDAAALTLSSADIEEVNDAPDDLVGSALAVVVAEAV